MLIYSFIIDYQAFNLRYKDNTTRDKNETKVGKQSANLGKNNEPIQNRLSFLIGCKSVILHHLAILSFPMVRPAWDNWWLLVVSVDTAMIPTASIAITLIWGLWYFFFSIFFMICFFIINSVYWFNFQQFCYLIIIFFVFPDFMRTMFTPRCGSSRRLPLRS